MRKKIAVAALVLLLGVAAPLRAGPVFYYFEDTTLVTGIGDLLILDNLYDVWFVEGIYDEVFPSSTLPTFFNEPAGTANAAGAIAHSLTFLSDATGFYRVYTTGSLLAVPLGHPDTAGLFGIPGLFHGVFDNGSHLFSQDLAFPGITSNAVLLWAVFTPANPVDEVPEPSSLLLLGLGLVTVLIRKRTVHPRQMNASSSPLNPPRPLRAIRIAVCIPSPLDQLPAAERCLHASARTQASIVSFNQVTHYLTH